VGRGDPAVGRFDSFAAPLATTMTANPLTVGTAGHIDHGKTRLVEALTGVDTDRLPEEKARGITIALGYAPLRLPSGRQLSLIDVPGHERLVRVMAAGAGGLDLFLLVIAADDGVMPQTIEHVRVLEALGVSDGVVAITKADLADPEPALRAAAGLLPGAEAAVCSARTGAGVAEVAAALERVARRHPSRSAEPGTAVLHIDRVFSIKGAGTVVTGTLWSGAIGVGDHLELIPPRRNVRVRSVQVHDHPVDSAAAGQRVAVNLAGVDRAEVQRGDALVGAGSALRISHRVEVSLSLSEPITDRERVQVHHGTRDTPARAVHLAGARWQLRTEHELLTAVGDRLVIRRISPAGTLGGGVVLEAAQLGRRPPRPAVAPLAGPALDSAAGLDERLREAGLAPLEELRVVVERIVRDEGTITLARLRDELGTSRKHALAVLQHFDDARLTRRLPDDRRVLR
jgi:selenocysteine-specific elongation factor